MHDAALEELLNASRDHAGGEPSETLRRVTRDFLGRARSDVSILKTAAEALPTLPPAGAAWLAVMIGAGIERGQSADLTTPAILECFRSWLPRLPTPEAAEGETRIFPEPTPEQVPWLAAFPQLCQSVVSHLARMPEHRKKLAEDLELLNRLESLESYTHGASWVREMLLRSSGTLIVLHPPSGAGIRLRYENVATCFHLFSLLQTAIGTRMTGGREPDAAIAAAARGKSSDKVSDEAWWHYGDPRSKTADVRASIRGEALVRSIPTVNGVQVMLLWPPMLESRSWDGAFFGPHLDALAADVVVEEQLSPDSCQAWFKALGIRAGPRRKGWWPW